MSIAVLCTCVPGNVLGDVPWDVHWIVPCGDALWYTEDFDGKLGHP